MLEPKTANRIKGSLERLISNAELAKKERLDRNRIRKYLLLSTPRTGSSAFCTHLKSAGLGSPSEWMNPIHINAAKELLGIDQMNFRAYWDLVLSGSSNLETNIFGINVHIDQYLDLRRQGIDLFRISFDQIYYLERKDKIAQAYSYQKSLQTGIWSKEAAIKAGTQKTFSVTPTQLCESLLKITSEHEFAVNNIRFSERNHFIFENMIHDRHSSYVARVAEDFGLETQQRLESYSPSGKQSDDKDTKSIEELKNFLGLSKKYPIDTVTATREQ